jgi:hypothetical protein
MPIPGIRKRAKGSAANLPCWQEPADDPPKHEALCARATAKAGSSAGWSVSGDADPADCAPTLLQRLRAAGSRLAVVNREQEQAGRLTAAARHFNRRSGQSTLLPSSG